MADRDVPGEPAEDIFVEDRAEQAHLLVRPDRAAVGDGDAGGLLAAVLQCVKREVREARYVAPGREDPRYPAHLLLLGPKRAILSGGATPRAGRGPRC